MSKLTDTQRQQAPACKTKEQMASKALRSTTALLSGGASWQEATSRSPSLHGPLPSQKSTPDIFTALPSLPVPAPIAADPVTPPSASPSQPHSAPAPAILEVPSQATSAAAPAAASAAFQVPSKVMSAAPAAGAAVTEEPAAAVAAAIAGQHVSTSMGYTAPAGHQTGIGSSRRQREQSETVVTRESSSDSGGM